jgi:hypothetical protein
MNSGCEALRLGNALQKWIGRKTPIDHHARQHRQAPPRQIEADNSKHPDSEV